uniref:Shortage in chiasmata 1 n=1 Tax=Leptobrachium leishanense TaxID=445787 RepID=A0A8C5W7A6_9ANUR
METSIFPAFKFLALDYVYENVIKKKVTTSLMCLPFPEEVQEKENYCHDRIFTSDDYRRPWTRSSALSVYKVHHDGSALEELKQCTDITDRLEKRRTPCSIFTTNGELSVVPSSNPDSLTDLEEIFSIAEENDFSEDEQTNGECWSLSVPSSREKTPEAYLFQDDLVFDDYLAKYQSHLPSLATLSRRIKTINVEDPLINWRRNISAFEQLFRVNTSKAMDTKQNACPEEFHVERTDFTENLMLPCPVTINDYPTRSGNCVAKVTSMLQLAPEIMEYSQAEGQNTCTEFQLKVAVKRHFLEHLLIKRNLDLTKYENIEDGVSRTSKHEVELEVPLTPPDTSNKCWMHTSDFQCAAEEISSSPPKLQVIKKRGDILESLSCMSDVYHLLLKDKLKNNTTEPEINSPSPASTLLEAGLEELSSSVEVPPSESQCQAYKVIQATAAPILRKLKDLGLVECMNWEFNTVTFDCSRFLLRQQEKNLTDSAKTGQYEYAVGSRPHVPSREENAGKDHDKEVLLFKNASLYHIMVTLRDLVLMCSVDTAVGYLYEAKELYKSALGSSLDDVCRKLEIVQFVAKKKPDVNHKIAALQSNLLQWIEQRHVDDEQLKVLIITRMDTVDILIDGLCEIKSVKAVMCCPPPGRKCLESKSILDSLEKYTCIVVNNQHIGGDFPWSHVSLVIEYDCTDYWGKVCQGLQIPHMTLKTCTPDICSDDTILDSCMNSILQIQIPYVFIASEGLLKNPEVLQLLESSYNMTFIERGCSASILLFGNMLQCAQITVDECTSIILQDLGQLKHEKSSENLILKLVALSLQYSCCWILLYTKEIIHSEYSLSENILHNISLLYAAIISLTSSKSGELEVKVVLTSGVEKAGLMIRQIADHTLISSKNAPHKWMDRSWLSLMTSEAEQCLLAFPCINPMVAQLMLHRASSLKWLLSANNGQLHELFPELPTKVLKHFSDITSLHQLSISASSTPNDLSQSLEMENMYRSYFHQSLSVSREPDNNTKDLYLLEKHMTEGSNACEDLSLLTTNEMATSNVSIRPLLFYKGKHCKCVNSHPYQNMRHGQTPTLFHYPANYIDVDQAQLVCGTFLLENHDAVTESLQPSEEFILGKSAPTSISYAKQPLKTTHCVNVYAPPTNETACSTENSPDIVFTNNDKNIKCNGSCQLFHHGNLFQNKDYFITNLLNHQSLEKSNSLCDFIKPTQPMAPENQLQYTTKERPQSIFPNVSHHDLGNLHSFQFERGVIPGDIYTSKKHISPEKEMLNGLQCVQITQVKRRKLSYEKVPGRRDGQTRLKFF